MFALVRKFEEWLSRREQTRLDEQYSAGYNWAAGELLRDRLTPIMVEMYYDSARGMGHNNAFDSGAEDATDKLCALGIVEDDRFRTL